MLVLQTYLGKKPVTHEHSVAIIHWEIKHEHGYKHDLLEACTNKSTYHTIITLVTIGQLYSISFKIHTIEYLVWLDNHFIL